MPDTSTEVAIATTTLGADGTISFTSIPATYTDLRLVLTCTTVTGGGSAFKYNNDSSSLYSQTWLIGDGSSATSVRATVQPELGLSTANISATVPAFFTIDIFNYAGSTFKTSLTTASQDLNGSGQLERQVGLYRSTTAISSIAFTTSFKAGSTATLYGIL
jgi:hypothetical protein